jgi:hypothetical protein
MPMKRHLLALLLIMTMIVSISISLAQTLALLPFQADHERPRSCGYLLWQDHCS